MKNERYDVGRRFDTRRAGRPLRVSLLIRLARALEASRVPYLLTGADAVSYYGAPRRSDDKDLVITASTSAELHRVEARLREEGFDVRKLEPGHNTIFDSGFRIDIKVKQELEHARRIRLGPGLWLNLTTPENLILVKLEFWDGKSFESNDAQDVLKILIRQGRRLNFRRIRSEAMKRRTYTKLSKIEAYLTRARKGMPEQG